MLSVAPYCQKTPRTDGKGEKNPVWGGAAHSFAAVQVCVYWGD